MRKFLLLSLAVVLILTASAQDFSNKGKDFWVGYGYHQQMTNTNPPGGQPGGSQDMVLYFATDQVTNITISIPALGYTQNLTSPAGNNVLTSAIIPKTVPDARLLTEGISDKGIHVTSDKPMVAYAHIYNQSVSGATILYPTNTLGKEYYSVNYKNWSNTNNANCFFYVVAADTGTTTIEITPTGNTTGGWVAGNTYTVNLTQGQIYNVMGALTGGGPIPGNNNNPYTAYDLTGSKIKSIASGSGGCKKIAVFSGSGRISITCNSNSSSSDNYMVQSLPKTAWGKKYLTVPASGNQAFNFFRVCVTDPTTIVTINGAVTALPLLNNFYYEIPQSNQPLLIEGDKPIMVAQYFTSQGACGNGNPGDPEVIYLSSVEQNINKVLWNATPNWAITGHYFNAVVTNKGTAISSFKLDGVTVPAASFIPHPQDPTYSYIRQTVAAGPHLIQSDSGFNAIAYGFGNAESYGYNAGTNVRDLYQQIGVVTEYGNEPTPSVCTGAPFRFKVSLPYCADSIRWDLSNLPGPPPVPGTQIYSSCTAGAGGPDSITVINGKNIYWYSLPSLYSFGVVGTYPVNIQVFNTANADGCGNVQSIDFDLQVSQPPVPEFTWAGSGCVAEAMQFTETTPQIPKQTYRWWWDFGDPASGAANNSLTRNPTHLFSAPGTYNVRYVGITTAGCLTDTVTHQVTIQPLPTGIIDGTNTVCINSAMPDIVFTGSGGTAPYTFTYTIDPGTGPGLPQTVNSVGNIATIQAPTLVAGTFIYTLVSVKNLGSTLCTQNVAGQTATVTITPDATLTLTSAAGTDNQTVCINNPITNITYAVGGSGNGGSVTGLPAGVTGTYAGGVITITGTPSVSGTFIYTVNTTGPCVKPSTTGTITVTADATLALTSAAGTDNQTLCINTAITNITYAVGGTGTGGTVTGLPAGVTGTYAGGVITIFGTPTVSGTFIYTVNTTGPCVKPSATGTITVTADGTLTLTSAAGTDNQSLCINTPIINITYAVGGSGTGGSVSGLPPGVTAVFAGGVITISGTPSSIAGSPYIYTVTTTGPCIKPTATGTITVNPDAAITLTSAPPTTNQELCRNSTITNITYSITGGGTGATVTGLPAGVNGVFAGGIFTISGTPSVAGVFNYTVNTTGTCIQAAATGTITVDQLPTPNFSFTTPSCETRTIAFSDGSVANSGALNSWTWNFGDPASGAANTSTLQNPSHTFATAGTYTVTLTVTTTKGCVSNPIASIPVTINDRPQAGFIIPEVCLSDTYAQFLDTSKIAVGTIVAWNWNFGDPASGPLNTSTLQNPQHSYSAVGPYNVQLIVTSALGCKDTIMQVLTVNGSFPVANFTVNNPATLCANDSVAIVEASSVFPGVITKIEIYWDNVNFPAVFQTDNSPFTGKVYRHLYPNFQAPLTKVFTIRYRAYSGGVCVNDKLANITVNAAPLVQFNNMPDTCFLAAPFQITQASEVGGVPGTGVFSGPGVSPTGIFSPAIAGIGLHTIKYTFTSAAAGCVDTMSRTIRVLDTAHASFTNASPICEGTGASFTDLSTAPAGIIMTNTVWDFGDGTPLENHAPGSTFTHVFANPGTFLVRMYNVTTTGCNSTVFSKSVTVDPNHHITLSSANDNQTVCINTAIAPIVYTLSGGATNVTVTGLPAGVNYVVAGPTLTILGAPVTTAGSPFNYNIQTTGNTCTVATAAGTIAVNPDHTLTLSSAANSNVQSVCVNTLISPITYTLGGGATGATVTGLPAGVTYSVAGNILTINGTPNSTAGGPVFNYSIVTSGNSCIKANAAGSIKVNPYPVPNFSVDKPSYCIPNAIVKFTSSSTIEDGTESAFTYLWEFGDNLTSTSASPSHWYSSQGPFNVKLTVKSGAVLTPSGVGCAHDTTIVLNTIHPQPKADFTINKPSVCIKDDVTFTDNSDGKDGIINQWHWDLGDGTVKTTNTVTYIYSDTTTFNVVLYTINSFGCNSDTLTKQFTVYPYPHVNAGPDRNILEGGQIVLSPIVYGNDLQFLWTPNLYLIDNRVEKVKINKPLTDMTYRLTVTARGGCTLSDDVFVKLLKFPKIPNTFTPNGDGINDTWRIDYLNTYPNNRVQVFTRSGQLVFESRGYDTPWDGTIKGKPLPFDTYYYIIEPGNGRDPITGYVTIIK